MISSILTGLNALVVALVAMVGMWLAGRQMVIAQQRLQHDIFYRLFDMRFEIYKATREFLAQGFRDEGISEKEIQLYRLRTLEAKFLFDDELAKYLSEICQRITTWQHAVSKLKQLPAGQKDAGLEEMRIANYNWIVAQGDERTGFDTRFKPFLVPKTVQLPRWLCWPAPRDPGMIPSDQACQKTFDLHVRQNAKPDTP